MSIQILRNLKTNEHVKGRILFYNFLGIVGCLIFIKNVIHHSHITGKIIGYTYSLYNQKVRENTNQISVITHNLFDFHFFSFERPTARVWRTINISIGGTNLTNVNFSNISDQIRFIDTLKYYQKSLSVLASTMTVKEKQSIEKECERFIKKDQKLKFYKCAAEDPEWILN